MTKDFRIHNKRTILLLFTAFFFLFVSTILLPFFFINYFAFSGVGYFFSQNLIYGFISGLFLIYFIIIGEYYYSITIDSYVVKITSYRPLVHFFHKKDYIDIPHSMLVDYRFFNRPFSFNRTLMLKIRNTRGNIITKRFNLTMISNKDIRNLGCILEKIVIKNN